MKKILFFVICAAIVLPSMAVSYSSRSAGAAGRTSTATSSRNLMASTPFSDTTVSYEMTEEEEDEYAAERELCLSNNIGIGNTFVWASRYSDSSSYTSLIEDVENPENNVCFVRVELTSADPDVDLSFIPAAYYQAGQTLTCGDWANAEEVEQAVLDGKKTGRGWAIAGASIGGAGIGVGAMELFGNREIGGKVEGQENKKLSDAEVLRSQLLTLKKKDVNAYNSVIEDIKSLNAECKKIDSGEKPKVCETYSDDFIESLG